jgi:hypothetical protein
MKFRLISLLVLFCTTLIISSIKAQENYRAEIGIHGGGSFYLGDANNTLFQNMQPAFGLIYRQKFNPRIAAHINWNNSSVKGGILPDGTTVEFNNPVNAIDFCGEFNFFDLEKKEYKPFSKTYSTFVFAGIGGMLYNSEIAPTFSESISIPFGIGFKVMLGERFNLNLMWSNRLLFSDKLEGIESLNDASGLNGSNIFNRDLLSTISLGLTFNIWKDKCNCPEE